jgi:hypothetical protein
MASSFSSGLRVRPPGQAASFTYAVPVGGIPVLAAPAPISIPVGSEPGILRCSPGPWGDLDYHYIYLEASDHVVSHFPMPAATPKWSFRGETIEGLAAIFHAAQIPAEWAEHWLRPPCLVKTEGALHVLPPMEQLEALRPEQRTILYAELAKHEANEYHRDPLFITSGSVDEFLRHSGVSSWMARWFAQMCYRRGKVLCFSDVAALVSKARSSTEALRFMKLCTRTRAIAARLRVDEQTDFDALLDYWTDGNRRKDVASLLRSLGEVRQGIDIIHLLPPLVRKLLNGYPPFELAVKGRMPDCHWSSLNFFNYEPRDYYLDTRLASSHVMENYQPTERPYRYGDKLLFVTDCNECFHSCVFVADDIVFTKNGDNAANPWILMHLADLEQVYLSGTAGRLQAYRKTRR